LESKTGCPAQLLIAQWALESKWGAKPAGNANFFGVKKSDRHEKCCTVSTREVVNGKSVVQDLDFADYDSLEDSCKDYAWLITQGAPYHQAWAQYQKRPESARADRGGRRQIRDRPAICIPGRHDCRPVERGAGHRRRAPGGAECNLN